MRRGVAPGEVVPDRLGGPVLVARLVLPIPAVLVGRGAEGQRPFASVAAESEPVAVEVLSLGVDVPLASRPVPTPSHLVHSRSEPV